MLHLHRSARADGLVAMLAELLVDPLEDPMTAEVVAVPTRGVERWLTQQLSRHLGTTPGRHDGVCANVDSPFPGTVIDKPLRFRDFVVNSRACKLYDFDDGRWLTYTEARRHTAAS